MQLQSLVHCSTTVMICWHRMPSLHACAVETHMCARIAEDPAAAFSLGLFGAKVGEDATTAPSLGC